MHLNPAHPALSEKRTIHVKMRREANERIFKSVSANDKMGKGKKIITRGTWKGLPLYSLTLEERETCPSDCIRWKECFGNGMPFAHRFEGGPSLHSEIMKGVARLNKKHIQGFAIRLHVLGDFYSVEYVNVWRCALDWFKGLHLYGYTARDKGEIGDAIEQLNLDYSGRCAIRFSRNQAYDPTSPGRAYAGDETVKNGFICPEMTGKVNSCLDCGLCWDVKKTVIFPDHDKMRKAK